MIIITVLLVLHERKWSVKFLPTSVDVLETRFLIVFSRPAKATTSVSLSAARFKMTNDSSFSSWFFKPFPLVLSTPPLQLSCCLHLLVHSLLCALHISNTVPLTTLEQKKKFINKFGKKSPSIPTTLLCPISFRGFCFALLFPSLSLQAVLIFAWKFAPLDRLGTRWSLLMA